MENIENKLVEDTVGAAEPNVAATDENLSLLQMYQQTALPSLGRQIFSVIPMHGPTAALFNIRKKDGVNDFELVRNDVEVYPSVSISTGLSKEAEQDIRAQYGKSAKLVIGTLLRGLANSQENTRTLEFLEAQALAVADLTLSTPLNAEVNLFEVTQKVHELILIANNENMRTYEAFAVLPANALGGIMGLQAYAGAESTGYGLFVTQIGKTKFYLNPDSTSTKAYVGLKDSENPSKSSAVFSPYIDTVVEATSADTGEDSYHIFNRFAITVSPLHEVGNEMLFKFNIL